MFFMPKQKRDVGVANRDAFKVVVIPAHQVEEILAAIAVEDHFAIARAFNHDWFVGRAALRQIVSAIERRAVSGDCCDRSRRK